MTQLFSRAVIGACAICVTAGGMVHGQYAVGTGTRESVDAKRELSKEEREKIEDEEYRAVQKEVVNRRRAKAITSATADGSVTKTGLFDLVVLAMNTDSLKEGSEIEVISRKDREYLGTVRVVEIVSPFRCIARADSAPFDVIREGDYAVKKKLPTKNDAANRNVGGYESSMYSQRIREHASGAKESDDRRSVRQAPNAPSRNCLQGSVFKTESSGLMVISIESSDGLKEGCTLPIYRWAPANYIGTIRILKVEGKMAVAELLALPLSPIQEGDRIVCSMLP